MRRVGVHEALEIDDAMRQMIQERQSDSALRKHALSRRMTALRENMARKPLSGTTTWSEIIQPGYSL